MRHPLVDEANKKAAVAWVAVPERPAVALWCLPLDGSLYLVSGTGEQAAPGLAYAETATVTLRGDHGGRIVTWLAEVSLVDPRSDEWSTVAPQLAGKRLNASGSAEDLVARWARECQLNRLTPAGAALTGAELVAGAGGSLTGTELPDGSLAEPPRESAAARPARRPFRLHRVRPR